jgi:hypothetical protein
MTRREAPRTPQEHLRATLARVRRARERETLPIVVFDLDSTLLDTQARNLRIVREFAAGPGRRFPGLEGIVASLGVGDMRYDARDTLRAYGVSDPAVLGELFSFWTPRFFCDDYVRDDEAAPGAPEYVRACHERGAHVWYLSARHVDRMARGTVDSLLRHGFPLLQPRCTLHMKGAWSTTDTDFKDVALAALREAPGRIVGFFENEPGHANRLLAEFPKATGYLRKSLASSTAEPPDPRLVVIDDFLPG